MISSGWIGRTVTAFGIGVCAAGVATAGCASGGGIGDGDAQPAAASRTMVRVSNHNWSDMVVYAARDRTGSRHRLGTVTSMRTETFEVPPSIVAASAGLRLIADPIGSRRAHVTQPISVMPGQTVEWTLESNLNLSSWQVR